jgi:hypothetical protein
MSSNNNVDAQFKKRIPFANMAVIQESNLIIAELVLGGERFHLIWMAHSTIVLTVHLIKQNNYSE